MNKYCYRIVFNRARSQLMAVAETASTCGNGSVGETAMPAGSLPFLATARGGQCARPRMKPVVMAAVLAAGVWSGANAQIFADPNASAAQRPTVLTDGAGRPLVNIQTPSAAGVSRNTYRQFDVGSNGAILNNSRLSNPWLATGEARVILNEVNSSNPSQLQGPVVVNGGGAQVIIANPSGLSVNGASFVNASRVTLTTGSPVMDNGALSALQVGRGHIAVEGAGLNVQGVPYTEILSRTFSLAGRLDAGAGGQVSVLTGAQTVDYATGGITPQAVTSPAPALAIDASALGSMYAGAISLVATEAGVGVRNQGALQAASQLILTAEGQLINAGSITAPLISAATVSGDLTNSGSMQATDAVLLSAGGNARLSGQGLAQTAGSALMVSARKGVVLEANTQLSSNATGGRVTLSARETVQLAEGSNVAAQAGVTISSDTQVRASHVQLSSSAGDVNVLAGEGLSLTRTKISASAIQLETGKPLADTNSPIDLQWNTLEASGGLTILSTGSLNIRSNSLKAGTHLHMGAAGGLTSASDDLRAGSIELIGQSISAMSLGAAASSGPLRISSSDGSVLVTGRSYLSSGSLSTATDLVITAVGGEARLRAVRATADHVRLNATGDTVLESDRETDLTGKGMGPVVESALNARKSLSVATVGAGRTLILGNSSLQAGTEDVYLSSAGAVQLGTAQVASAQASVFVGSAGAVSGIGIASLRAGQHLGIDAGQGDMSLSPAAFGNMVAGQDLSLTARTGRLRLEGWGGNRADGGTRADLSARDLKLQGASVDLLGSRLRASRDLSITATDGSVNISALENTVLEGGYSNRYMQGAELNAGRNLQIISASQIGAYGLKAGAGNNLGMQAAGSLELTGTSNSRTDFDGFWTTQQRVVNTSTLTAGNGLALSAGNDLLMDAVQARAGGAMMLNALGDVRLAASQNWRESTGTTVQSGKWSTTVTHHLRESITTVPTELSGGRVGVSAGNSLNTFGTRLNSSGGISLQAGGAANYYAVYDQVNNRDDSTKTRTFFGIRYSTSRSTRSSIEDTPLVTRLQSAAELVSNSGGDTLMQGTQVRALGGYSINAGVGERARSDARIILEGVRSTVHQSRTAKSDYVVWQSQLSSGSVTQTMALPSFAGGGTFSAPGGLSVQIPEGEFRSQIQTLAAQPGMDYLNALSARTDVNWQPVKLAYEQWNYKQEGLTPAGAALLAVAVAWALPAGAGANLIGAKAGTTTALMANASFTSLASTASITLVNNKGDVGKTLRDLGRSSTVKAALAAAVTAGVVEALGATQPMKELSTKTGFSEKLTYNLINATGRALTNAAINGGSLEDALKSALVGGLVDTAHGQAASAIKSLEADYLAHKLAHALAGCVAGAAAGGTCRDGAVGAAVGEVIAGPGGLLKPRNGMFYTEEEKRDVLAMTKLVAGATSAYAGGNAQTAITAAETAVTNNAFFVPVLAALFMGGAYSTYAGGGNPLTGLQQLGQGNDPLSKALANGTAAMVDMSMQRFPAETTATLNFLNSVAEPVGRAVNATVTYLDDKTGQVISTQWNNLSPATRDALVGSGKITSLAISAGGVTTLRSALTTPRGVDWTPDVATRGASWETHLAEGKYKGYVALNEVQPNHKTFDFFDPDTGHAVSAKTMDTLGLTHPAGTPMTAANAERYLRRYINDARGYEAPPIQKNAILAADISSKSVELAIPHGTPSDVRLALEKAAAYGRAEGVLVRITVVRK